MNFVLVQVREVLFRLSTCKVESKDENKSVGRHSVAPDETLRRQLTRRSSQTLVVLDSPALSMVAGRLEPVFVLRKVEESARLLLSLRNLDNRSNELLKKAWDVQERWPKVC
jgi:hypothetical protein